MKKKYEFSAPCAYIATLAVKINREVRKEIRNQAAKRYEKKSMNLAPLALTLRPLR